MLLLGLLFAASHIATAQAMVSAQRGAEIAPFAQTALVSPDWGPTDNLGYTVGLDYTRFIRSIVQPSLEIRMTSANGTTVSERTYAGGLKLETAIHGIHPYATLLAGKGFITFTHPQDGYLGDNSIIYSFGGGAEFNAGQHMKLRLDFTDQSWNIGPQTLAPYTVGVGIAYRLPFHNGAVR